MIYAIAVDFDKESTEKIRGKIIEIADSNVNPYMVNNKISPHLTLSLFEADDEVKLHKVLKEMSLIVSRKPILINSIGMFEPKVIYYSPSKSDTLIELNITITNKLVKSAIDPDKYYLPDKWVPHIALGVQLTKDEVIKSLEIVKKDFQPFEAIIEKLVLAQCNPYKEIVEYII